MILLKPVLVAVSVLLSSLASRRFGHAVGGVIAGMPMIAGPIVGFVLLQQGAAQVQAIALATLVCLPATILHLTTFAWCATRTHWAGAFVAANAVYLLASAALLHLHLPAGLACGLALLAPAAGLAAMPRWPLRPAGAAVARIELACRVGAAWLMAYALIRGASVLPALASGLLLATPITGNVLPCFTLPRHGPAATAALLSGFMRGLFGFGAFFVVLGIGLGSLPTAQAYGLAWLAAAGVVALTRGGGWLARRFARA